MVASLAEARSHNVPPEVFMRHWREIRAAKDAHADTGMALARAKKAAKASGVDLDAFKMVEKLSDLDTDEAEMQLRHARLYAGWIELPIGTQLGMFGEEAPPQPGEEATQEHRDWTAGEAGKKAGETGELRTANTHSAGTSEYVAWDKAWTKGNKVWLKSQGKIAAQMGKNAATPVGGMNGARAAVPGRRGHRGNGAAARS